MPVSTGLLHLHIPLRSGSVTVLIRGFVADVGCELLYRNEEPGPVEAVFVFPVDAEAAIYAFQARLGGACIEAQLHEKKEAQELYGDALAGGQSSFLLQQEGAGGDIFSCSLGNLPPGEEAALTLRYVCELPLEPDGAARYMLPAVLRPRYTSLKISWLRQGGLLPYFPSFLRSGIVSSCALNTVSLENCQLSPVAFPVSLAEAPPWDRDVELLVYYTEPHKPSAVLEVGLPGAEPGSLMGDPAVMVTLLPSLPEAIPGQSSAGEFIFLLDRSNRSPQRIDSAKKTLVLLLKSLPLGCYFNIYGFGSRFESFYRQSVGYTQQTMAKSLQRVRQLQADLGGTEILAPLRSIYRSPCRDGHPRQLFVFTDGEVGNTQDVIAEVQRYRGAHRWFSFGIGEGASTALVKGIARAAGGSAEFITGQDRMQPKALQSLKRALQLAVTGISLSWDLPPGMEAALLGRGPEVIFPGQRCLIYAQLRGQHQEPPTPSWEITLKEAMRGKKASFKKAHTVTLCPRHRLPVHRLAAKSLLLELEGTMDTGSEGDRRRALETSLSSGVVCSLTAYVGVDMERRQPAQGPLVRQDIPLIGNPGGGRGSRHWWGGISMRGGRGLLAISPCLSLERAPEEFPLLRLVSLQNADGSWDLDPRLAAALGAVSLFPAQDVAPGVWATVLAVVWLHGRAAGQRDEWELLEAKAVGWVRGQAGETRVGAANTLLGCSVGPTVFGF
uniref:von Willebrand factor A domain-containing protein 5A n=1 Tax=Chrysemys picta bellii TaxID=8478 RepID=A0A8C3F6S2_CHRPI